MIRIELADRRDADRLVTAAYIAAGLIPPPAVPEPGALALANDLARQVEKLPPAPEVTRDGA